MQVHRRTLRIHIIVLRSLREALDRIICGMHECTPYIHAYVKTGKNASLHNHINLIHIKYNLTYLHLHMTFITNDTDN